MHIKFIKKIDNGCDQNTSSNSSGEKGNNTGKEYIPLVNKGISENGIWGNTLLLFKWQSIRN